MRRVATLTYVLVFPQQHERVLTVPNALTLSRILLSPLLGYLVIQEAFPLACGLFFIVGLTDLVSTLSTPQYPSLGYLVIQEAFPLACGLFFIVGLTDLVSTLSTPQYPSLWYLVIQEAFPLACGLFFIVGLTDLVSTLSTPQYPSLGYLVSWGSSHTLSCTSPFPQAVRGRASFCARVCTCGSDSRNQRS